MKRKANRRGFTLIELMIVIAIIGVLAAIAIPDFNHARLQARQKACLANMRVLEGAVDMWEMDQDAAGFGGSGVEAADCTISKETPYGLRPTYVKK
ncbi:MAG: prepilin-type N-terminal cleavage/methylation domain-containing protein, partial [bacterium]|nr:prepilin-type N-terminal cleavage/methylation domain-containing protein [bacterium]